MRSATEGILLVEDSGDDVFIFKRALRAAQVHTWIDVVSNGREAVAYLTAATAGDGNGTRRVPSIVFLDLKVPYLDGFEILAWMRAQPALGTLPAVVLSGSDEPQDLARARDLGVRSYLVKPPSATELRRLIETAIAL